MTDADNQDDEDMMAEEPKKVVEPVKKAPVSKKAVKKTSKSGKVSKAQTGTKEDEDKETNIKDSYIKNKDIYKQVSVEYDSDYKKESTTGGFNQKEESSMYSNTENQDIATPLDGEALTKEIGGTVLTKELYDTNTGAGFKDRRDLQDLLSSIKGASVFMNHTPKEQL